MLKPVNLYSNQPVKVGNSIPPKKEVKDSLTTIVVTTILKVVIYNIFQPLLILAYTLAKKGLIFTLKALWKGYLFVGSKVFRNMLVCHLITITFLSVCGYAGYNHIQLDWTSKTVSQTVQKNQELERKIGDLEARQNSNLEALKAIEVPAPTETRLAQADAPVVITGPMAKWQSHLEYIKPKMGEEDYKKVVAGFRQNQEEFGFYTKSTCHPYLMAALHYRETGYRLTNASNGQGMYQIYSSAVRYPANSPVTNATDQTNVACDFIKAKATAYCSAVGTARTLTT